MSQDSWVRIASAPCAMEAHAWRLALEERDIPVRLTNESQGAYAGVGGAMGVELLVPADRVEDARAALASTGTPKPSDTGSVRCGNCDETNPANFEACWSCGEDLAGAKSIEAAEQEQDRNEPPPVDDPLPGPPRRVAALELSVVLLVAWLPLLFWVIDDRGLSESPTLSSELLQLLFLVPPIALMLFLVWRNREGWRILGLADVRWGREFLTAVPILLLFWGLDRVVVSGAQSLGLDVGYDPPDASTPHWGFYAIVPITILVGAIYEEMLYRAYVWNRLKQLGVLPGAALLICSAAFALPHPYESGHVLSIFVGGMFLGAVFWGTSRLPRLVFAHAAYNAILFYSPLFADS